MKNVLCLTAILSLASTTTYAQDCNLNEDARHYFVRANAAVKEAKNDADYLNAVEEFKKALEYAPDCPDIYYNIGIMYDKSANSGLPKDIFGCRQAMAYLKKHSWLPLGLQFKIGLSRKNEYCLFAGGSAAPAKRQNE